MRGVIPQGIGAYYEIYPTDRRWHGRCPGVPALGNQPPLEAAATPTMDRLAKDAEMLLVRTVPVGYPPGSDVANLSLLGYEPELYSYRPRTAGGGQPGRGTGG